MQPNEFTDELIVPPVSGLIGPWGEDDWSDTQVFIDSDDYFCTIIDLIEHATREIILSVYIFKTDSLGKRVIDALKRALQRGVDIKILLDGVGIMTNSTSLINSLVAEHLPFRIFHPLPWQPIAYAYRLRRSTWVGDVVFCLLRINKRNHSKLALIDRQYLACGSANISDDHLSREQGGKNWHDYNAIVSGPAAADISDTFMDLWHYRKPRFGQGLFRHYWNNLNQSLRRKKNQLLREHIEHVQHRLWIINPYFSPTRGILDAICETAKRGVDVRLIVPQKSDVALFPLLTSSYYTDLLKAGVVIYEYLPAILHAKVMLMDNRCLIGSSNLNHRSLLHDVELDIVIENSKCISQLEQYYLADQKKCDIVTLQDIKLRGPRRLIGWSIRLLRYWF